MAALQDQFEILKREIETCKNPLIFYDDDPDGLCSFLILKKKIGRAHGLIMKSTPYVKEEHLSKIDEYEPDKVFLLDLANAELAFIENCKIPVVWVDHHEPAKHGKAIYINPQNADGKPARPTTYMCYKAAGEPLWIAAVGCVADWHVPDFIQSFIDKYPKILDKIPKSPPEALFETKLGNLAMIFSFLLKGTTENVKRNISALNKIKDPNEILNKTSPAGKVLYNYAQPLIQEFDSLFNEIEKKVSDDLILFYTYTGKNSFTKDLSNKLLYKHSDKIIILAREKGGYLRMSLRGSVMIRDALKHAVNIVGGTGGGHPNACGAVIKEADAETFLNEFRAHL